MIDYDAAVIGGGLAGCGAAITLAERGMRVAVFEAGTYPRHKVCGEFLSPDSTAHLRALGVLERIQAQRPARLRSAVITSPDGMCWEANMPGEGLGFSRYALDCLLAERAREAGADVITRSSVTRIDGDLTRGFALGARTTTGEQSVTARMVIGAHGKREGIDRTLGRRFLNTPQPFVGFKAHFHGDPLPGRVDVHAFRGGYCGLSEVEGGVINVCLLARTDVFQRYGSARIPDFIDWMRSQNPRLDRWLAAAEMVSDRWYGISQIPFVPKEVVERDVLMAGDAAGLIAPLAGDGMSIALHNGRMAADHAAAFLDGKIDVPDLRRMYRRAWRETFAARLRLGRFLQPWMFEPRLLSFGLRLLHHAPAVGRYLVKETRGGVA